MRKKRNKPGPKPKSEPVVEQTAEQMLRDNDARNEVLSELELDETDVNILFYAQRYPGITNEQLGKLVGLAASNVSRRRNAPKYLARLEQMNATALKVVEDSVKKAAEKYVSLLDNEDPSIRERVASKILTSAGILKQKVEVGGDFWEPFIVQSTNGTQTVMGIRQKEETPAPK